MATVTLSEFQADIYTRDNQLPELPSDEAFYSLLKRAIVNVRSELRSFEPSVFEEWLENQTSPVAFPDDLVQNEIPLFYPKDEYKYPMGGQLITTRNGAWYIDGYTDFSVKYSKQLPRATSMDENLPFKMEKCQEILISEMMALINGTYEQNEAVATVTNALTQSNRVK
ncbi:MAG: hypothetical protein DRP02_02385 [Candidatus Gerdarchaeota archaeon]|nr:MAG: hypothetical protein DRP02_02385 [Candidatus Gerdarchaeota archaeon]